MKYVAERVTKSVAKLGECPLWSNYKNILYWIDIQNNKIFVFDPKTKLNNEILVSEQVCSLAEIDEQNLIVAIKNGFAKFNILTKEFISFKKINAADRFNDGKCDPLGRFWAGTMVNDNRKNSGGLYCIDGKLNVRKILNDILISNGLAWSLDNKTFYFIDTPRQKIYSFEFDINSGTVKQRKNLIIIPKNIGAPDGMTIDKEGMLWVALYGGGKVVRYNTLIKELVDEIIIPEVSLITSCCFGGEDLDDIYITTAFKKDEPYSGSLYRIKTKIKGNMSSKFKLLTYN